MKSNLVVAISDKLRTETNPELKKFGLSVQDVTVIQNENILMDNYIQQNKIIQKFGIGKDYVPYSQYSFVTDGFGVKKQIVSFQDGTYYSEDGFITNPITTDSIEIPEDSLLIGFVRAKEHYTVFIPVIGLIENEEGLSVYDFYRKTFNETYTSPRIAFLDSINDFERLKKLAIQHYSYPFDRLIRHPDSFNGDFVTKQKAEKIGIRDFRSWEIKFL